MLSAKSSDSFLDEFWEECLEEDTFEEDIKELKNLVLTSAEKPKDDYLLTFKDLKDRVFTVMDQDFVFYLKRSNDSKRQKIGQVSKSSGTVMNHKNEVVGRVFFKDGFFETVNSGLIASVSPDGIVKNMIGQKQLEIQESTLRNSLDHIVARVEGLGRDPPLLPLILIGAYVVFFNPLHRINASQYYKSPVSLEQKRDYLLDFEKDGSLTNIEIVDTQHRKIFQVYNEVARLLLDVSHLKTAQPSPTDLDAETNFAEEQEGPAPISATASTSSLSSLDNEERLGPVNVQLLKKILLELKNYAEYHFATEESLFRYMAYPGAQVHVDEHLQFVAKIGALTVETTMSEEGQFPKYALRMRRSLHQSLASTARVTPSTSSPGLSQLATDPSSSAPDHTSPPHPSALSEGVLQQSAGEGEGEGDGPCNRRHMTAAEREIYECTFFDILLFLRKWVLEHTAGLDIDFAHYIREHGVDLGPWEASAVPSLRSKMRTLSSY
eukprot:GCRY01003443.1.p1 GENE.GCRY01003443.1~~GCRY01003443.1.p1  ORF type:complete len:494 (+),score=109.41 GCRY01003443.1:189-1670(+)